MLEGILDSKDHPYLVGAFSELVEDIVNLPIDEKQLSSRFKTLYSLKSRGGIEIHHPEEGLINSTMSTGVSILKGLGYTTYEDPTAFLPDMTKTEGFSKIIRTLFGKGFLFSTSQGDSEINRIQMLGLVVPAVSTHYVLPESISSETVSPLKGIIGEGCVNSLFVITESNFAAYKRGVGRELFYRIQELPRAFTTNYYDNIVMIEMDFAENAFLVTEAFRF